MTISHELHEQVHTMFYLSYTQQTYSIALVCMPYVFARIFFLNRSKYNVTMCQIKRGVFESFLVLRKNISLHT